mgnify:CR=1 FL=1
MRTQTLSVLDGKADLTDATFSQIKGAGVGVAAAFLFERAGATASVIAELFGAGYAEDQLHSIAKSNPYMLFSKKRSKPYPLKCT